MAVKYYRYPADSTTVEENFDALGSYSDFEEDEYLNLPTPPADLERALDKILGDNENPFVIQYIDDIKDLKDAYVGAGIHGTSYTFDKTVGNYFMAFPEFGLDMCVVPKELKKDLDFVLRLDELNEYSDLKDMEWLPKTEKAFEKKLALYGLKLSDYQFVIDTLYLTPLERLQNYNGKGNLDLQGTNITSLPEDLKVGGSLNLQDTNINFLPEGLKVKGYLNLQGTNITSLPEDLKVGGSLYLYNTNVTSLPEGLEVGEGLDLENTSITSLPKNLIKVKGNLNLNNTNITSLPEGLKVGGGLYLENTPITFLPEGLEVRESLYLRGTKITSLPEDLKVGGYLNLEDTKITSLPEDLKVGGYLNLEGTNITSLPEDLEVEGTIYLPDGTEVKTIEEAREYLEKQNKQKNSAKTSQDFLKVVMSCNKNKRYK